MADPTILILASLADGDKHGYAIMEDIQAFTGIRLGPGTLYGAICRLEGRGCIRPVKSEARKQPYRKMPAQEGALHLYVADGVGINFLPLPDIGAKYRLGNEEWRVWPGQALEGFIIRRALPEYPRGTNARRAVSVFVEYLIRRDGSVKVLRASGPGPYGGAARSAIERWVYQPLEYENHPCEVVSRLEVRFDGEFAGSAR
jgi:hypothetical protein